jgi:hypothetical protein
MPPIRQYLIEQCLGTFVWRAKRNALHEKGARLPEGTLHGRGLRSRLLRERTAGTDHLDCLEASFFDRFPHEAR